MEPSNGTPNPASEPDYGSSSKVRVEYTDPSGIFVQLAPEIQARFPLRKLNWHSQGRPLRSIDQLFVELVPDHARPTSKGGPEDGSGSDAPKRERRHQIPGLRSTPYLKVYLLRCDDSDSYKSSARKLIREWLKTQSTPTKKSSKAGQENHDAFEWLIIHLALVNGKDPWPTRTQASILEKLRSDFNSSSKSAPDRIAQIPFAGDFQATAATSDIVPAGPARDHFIRESNLAWDALLQKFKTLILMSFDQRVRQYEDDIKEKGAQRNIPGWNFCTFFMFKEGLAMGFENVGLLDDALMVYDELSVELLTAIRDQHDKSIAGERQTLFRDYTQDLFEQAEAAWSGTLTSPSKRPRVKLSTSFLDAEEKPYRELIMANNISVFDFRCYVFARQMAVLLRISHSSNAKALHSNDRASADPATLGEICRRALSFIASTSRAVRSDLQASFKSSSGDDAALSRARHDIIENLVASWTFSAAQFILSHTEDATLTQEIEQQHAGTNPETRRFSSIPTISAPPNSAGQIPQRSHRPQSVVVFSATEKTLEDRKAPRSKQREAALIALAFQRAELVSLTRKALKSLGDRAGWDYRRSGPRDNQSTEELDEVDINNNTNSEVKTPPESKPSSKHFTESIPNETIRNALASEQAFYKAFEDLSWQAQNLYEYSEDDNSLHAILADIATLKYHLKEYSLAASYFHQLAPFYAEHDWSELETAVLDRYAWCLNELGRKEEYVRVALKLLGKSASLRREGSGPLQSSIPATTRETLQYHLRQVLEVSKSFSEPIKTPLRNYFLELDVSHQITHHTSTDGFSLELTFIHAMADTVMAEKIAVRMVGTGDNKGRAVDLETGGPVDIKQGKNHLTVVAKTLYPGPYFIECVSIYASNIIFQYQLTPPEGETQLTSRPSIGSDRGLNDEPIVLWPRRGAVSVIASPQPHIHLEEARSIQVEIVTGAEAIENSKLQLKAGTSGLRLHISDARAIEGCTITEVTSPSILHLGAIAANQRAVISIPYQLDHEFKEIQFRSDLTYTTEHGEFITGDNHGFGVNLPLGVNAQDLFQEAALFSKFSITTSSGTPLRILECRVEDTNDFSATTPYQDSDGQPVFARQPVSMVYRIVGSASNSNTAELDTRLLLHVSYRCLDEEILAALLARLSASIEDNEAVMPFLPLLASHLRRILKDKIPRMDLNMIGLLRDLDLGSYEDFGWDRVLAAVAPSTRTSVQSWLEKWHEAHASIPLDPAPTPPAPVRLITIPVDVPAMPVLHTARLKFDARSSSPPHTGTPLSATLHIRHTRRWAQPASTANEPLKFIFELDAPPDTWLLGGPRRCAFEAVAGQDVQFELLLVPLRAGRLLVPGLDIRFANDEPSQGGDQAEGDTDEPTPDRTCEVDYLSQAETVLVLPGVGSVSAGLGFDAGVEGEGAADRRMGFGSSWVLAAEGYGEETSVKS